MLTATQACKQETAGGAMSSLLTKYGVSSPSDVIEVDESPAKQETKETKATRKSKSRDPEKSPKQNKKA